MVEAGKTAREISRENGGTQTNQDAAGAWVDGPSQRNPIVQGIANDLARFAQTDGRKFNEELTAVAPSESAVMNFMSETNNRIFSAVDYHLRAKNDDTENQLLYGVNIWAMPYYGKSKQKDIGKVSGYDSKSYGIIAGIDKQITQHVKLGIGGRYEETDISSKRRDYDVTTSTAFAYGEYKPNEWFINGVVKYDFADWDEKRYAVKRIIKANYRVDVLSANMMGGYEYRKNTWLITPQAGLRWHRINRHGYTDMALQTISGHNTDILSGVAGLRIQNNSEIKGHKIHPSLYAGITYDINSGKDGGVVTLTNGTSYHYEGATMKRFAVEVSPSITYDITDKLSFAVEYTGAFREHYQNHTASVGVNYQF
jgi:outer membrane autotransporter protein